MFTLAADTGAKNAEAQGANMVKPTLTAAERAKIAKGSISDSTKEIMRAQQQLVDEGIRLAENVRTPYQIMEQQVKALQAALAKGAISSEQFGLASSKAAMVSQNAYASMAAGIAGDLESAFGKSKLVAIASALVNTYQSVTNAMANIPAPFNIAAAAAALAAGMAQVANIKSTSSKSTSSKGGGAAGAGGGGGAGPPPGASAGQTMFVQGLDPGALFTGAAVREMASKFLEFQRDGGELVLK